MPEQIRGQFILGINYSGYHDSSVAVLDREYRLHFAVAEERYTRFKKDGRYPLHALKDVSERFSGIEAIAVACEHQAKEPVVADRFWHDPCLLTPEYTPVRSHPIDEERLHRAWDVPIYTFDHHLCHAQAGFFMSGFEDALILTCDGGMIGCPWNAGIYNGSATEGVRFITGRLQSTYVQIVRLYTDITAILGFRPNIHEGKITGLAGRGRANERCEQALLDLEQVMNHAASPLYFWVGIGREEIPASLETNQHLAEEYRRRLGGFSSEDIAYAVQRITEQRILDVLARARELVHSPNLVLAGGLFANVRVNLECKRAGFEQIFICPPMGDDGLSVGAAVLAASGLDRTPPPIRACTDLFLGPEPDPAGLPAWLDKLEIKYQRPALLHREVAQALADGKTVARVRGRMEFGPRALGHRSIYYQPTDSSVNDWLNQKLHRSEFMPFAPIVRAENAPKLFKELEGAEHTARFMTICLPCKPAMKKKCPAVVHVDGTARPQLVDAESAPDPYAILTHYEELTGLPALINTSFNVHDEPIVSSWRDAIVAFFQSGLDVLALEDLLIAREANATFAAVIELWNKNEDHIERSLRRAANAVLGAQVEEIGHYNEELKKAKDWLEGEYLRQQRVIEELTQAQAHKDEEIDVPREVVEGLTQTQNQRDGENAALLQGKAALEQANQANLEAANAESARLAEAVREKEVKILDLAQSMECLECKIKKRDHYIVELMEAKDYLDGEIKKKDKYIQELYYAKVYLDGELVNKTRYIEALLEAKAYLDGEIVNRGHNIETLEATQRRLEEDLKRKEAEQAQWAEEKASLKEALRQQNHFVETLQAAMTQALPGNGNGEAEAPEKAQARAKGRTKKKVRIKVPAAPEQESACRISEGEPGEPNSGKDGQEGAS